MSGSRWFREIRIAGEPDPVRAEVERWPEVLAERVAAEHREFWTEMPRSERERAVAAAFKLLGARHVAGAEEVAPDTFRLRFVDLRDARFHGDLAEVARRIDEVVERLRGELPR